MLSLPTFTSLDPKLKRIFDEISSSAINGKIEPFYIDDNRRVGILTSTPKYTLDVNGSIYVQGTAYVNKEYVLNGLIVGGGLSVATDAVVSGLLSSGHVLATDMVSPPVAKFWVRFTASGGVVAVNASYNVASVTRTSVGLYVVNFKNTFGATTSYCSMGMAKDEGSGDGSLVTIVSTAVGSVTVSTINPSTLVAKETTNCNIVGFGV